MTWSVVTDDDEAAGAALSSSSSATGGSIHFTALRDLSFTESWHIGQRAHFVLSEVLR